MSPITQQEILLLLCGINKCKFLNAIQVFYTNSKGKLTKYNINKPNPEFIKSLNPLKINISFSWTQQLSPLKKLLPDIKINDIEFFITITKEISKENLIEFNAYYSYDNGLSNLLKFTSLSHLIFYINNNYIDIISHHEKQAISDIKKYLTMDKVTNF